MDIEYCYIMQKNGIMDIIWDEPQTPNPGRLIATDRSLNSQWIQTIIRVIAVGSTNVHNAFKYI